MDNRAKNSGGTELNSTTLFTNSYTENENCMTRGLLQIVQAGGIDLLWHIATALELELPSNYITVITQKKYTNSASGNFVCDGLVSIHPFKLLIESKIVPCAIRDEQLANYCATVENWRSNGFDAALLYITPDSSRPSSLESENITWCSWDEIFDILDSFPNKNTHITCLIDGLRGLWNGIYTHKVDIPIEEKVVVLAGRIAHKVAHDKGIYYCQHGRNFNNAKYLAFYANKVIADIYEVIAGPMPRPQGITDGNEGDDFYELKHLDIISAPIVNDCKDKRGNVKPFTMGIQRYVRLDTLREATTISELKKLNNMK